MPVARGAASVGHMPRYRIELRTAERVWDSFRLERDDLKGLRSEMASFVGRLLQDHSEQLWEDQDWRIDVADDRGLILYVMHISATDSAATMSLRR